jgi:hypothetical protein
LTSFGGSNPPLSAGVWYPYWNLAAAPTGGAA